MRSNNNNTVRSGSRSILLIAALIILLGGTISGTVAWMFVKSEPVSNTFTYGDIGIELTESDTSDNDNNERTNSYSLSVQASIAKDPQIAVTGGSESCWLFVEVIESDNFSDYLEYRMAADWQPLEDHDGVYYRQVEFSSEEQIFGVLYNNEVSVKDVVTQQMLDDMEEEDYPTLDFVAYAIQQAGVDKPADAWALAK